MSLFERGGIEDSCGDRGALGSRGFDGEFDYFSVGFAHKGAGAAGAACASGTPDTMKVDGVGLGGFVVDNGGDVFDIETT